MTALLILLFVLHALLRCSTANAAESRAGDVQIVPVSRLDPEAQIIVTVKLLTPDGAPLVERESDVYLLLDGERTERGRVATDEQGRLTLVCSAARRARLLLLVKEVGYAEYGPWFVTPTSGRDLTLRLVPCASLTGRVVSGKDGAPIPGVSGRVMSFGRIITDVQAARFTTNDDGLFALEGLLPGRSEVRIDRRDAGSLNHPVELRGGATLALGDVVIPFERETVVIGQVFKADGRTPFPDAQIHRGGYAPILRTDAEGRFAIPKLQPASLLRVAVRAEGYAPKPLCVQLPKEGDPDPIHIVLDRRGGSISGRVVDAETGHPLSGETVVAFTEDDPSVATWFTAEDSDLRPLSQFENFGWFRAVYVHRTVTDLRGEYVLDHLAAGKHFVMLIREKDFNDRRSGVVVREGEATSRVDLQGRRRKPGYLSGRFLDARGRTMTGVACIAEYTCRRPDGITLRNRQEVRTDDEGHFHWRITDAGDYRVTFQMERHEPVRADVALDPRQTPSDMDIVFKEQPAAAVSAPPPSGRISGFVFLPDGKTPAVGASVMPFTVDAQFPEAREHIAFGGEVFRFAPPLFVSTDERGAFLIAGLRPGRYGVMAGPTWRMLGPQELPPEHLRDCLRTLSDVVEVRDGFETRNLRLVLDRGGRLRVAFLDADTGAQVPNARFLLDCGDRRVSVIQEWLPQAEVQPDGSHLCRGVPPGEYSIGAWAPGYVSHHDYRAFFRIEAGEELAGEFRLNPVRYGSVSGRVLLPDGRPAAVTRVYTSIAARDSATVTDAEGRFNIEKINAGKARIAAESEGFAVAVSDELIVPENGTARAELRLSPGGVIEGQVLSPDGETPLREAPVFLAQGGRGPFPIAQMEAWSPLEMRKDVSDRDGRFRFERVPEHPVHVWVQQEDRILVAEKDITVTPRQRREIVLRVPAATSVLSGQAGPAAGTAHE